MMSSYFCRAMLCKRGLCRHAVYVRPSVCVSVTFVNSVKTNKNIFNIFSPSVSQAILVFPYQAAQQYSDGTPPLTGASITGEVGRNRDSEPIWLHCVLSTLRPARCYQHRAAGPRSRKLWNLWLVVNGGVCWWRETTTKCLWQEVSTLRRQNSI